MAGIFDKLFGRETSQQTDQQQTVDTTAEKTTAQQQQTETTTASGGVQATQQTTLDPAVQAALADAITGLDLGQTAERQAGLAALLEGRATQAESDIQSNIAAILEGARATGERELAGASSRVAEQTGSTANTLQQLIGQEARSDLETQLAQLGGELGIQGRQAVTDEISGALTALGQQATSGAGVASVLKGAEVTGRTEEQSAQFQQQNLAQLIEELTKGQSTTTQTGSTQQQQSGNVLDILDSIAKIL